MATSRSTIERLKAEAQKEARTEIAKQKKAANAAFPNVPEKPTISGSGVLSPTPPNVHKLPATDAMRPTVTGRKKREFVMPDISPKAVKERKERTAASRRLSETEILAKYPHARKGTLQFDEKLNKQTIEAKLQCSHIARVATSDLFQVKRCVDCRKQATKERVQKLKKSDPKKSGINGRAKK